MPESESNLLVKLGKEIREAGKMLDRDQARFLVSLFYELQEHRIALNNQDRTLKAIEKPSEVVAHFATQMSTLERQMISVLDKWTMASEVGVWSRNQTGVGPILAAGLMAHIDIEKAPTVGHIWRFAGLDPTFEWLGRERAHELIQQCLAEFQMTNQRRVIVTPEIIDWLALKSNRKIESLERLASRDGDPTIASLERALALRPYNADLKLTCWKIGDSFVKVSGREDAFYGRLYRQRKIYEQRKNDNREYADQAADTLRKKRIQATDTKKWYEDGMLPPGRIDLRARRWAVKLFLAAWHEVAYVERYGVLPPAPYPIEHLGHAHEIVPDFPEKVLELRRKAGRPIGRQT